MREKKRRRGRKRQGYVIAIIVESDGDMAVILNLMQQAQETNRNGGASI